jgi:dinuclear metal center YbgI/SA1388 family protein
MRITGARYRRTDPDENVFQSVVRGRSWGRIGAMPALRNVLALLESWYPPRHAESWDAVGLVCGDPDADVARILLAVDPVLAVADEAVTGGADLLLTHHPLFLRGTSTVAADTPKGRVVHRLLQAGCALYAAHTNADAPTGGVSESLALALGLVDPVPLDPDPADPLDKIVVFAPLEAAEKVRDALTGAGAGAIGDYDSCTFTTPGEGRFRPLEGARPAIGSVGRTEVVEEVRIEAVCARPLRGRAVAAMLAAHPYEEPAYDVIELAALDDRTLGSGRIGRLAEPTTLRGFADRVAAALPATAHWVRAAGDPEQPVETVALCGGAGDFLLDRARSAGADVYLTSDLRHHPASELREHAGLGGAPALVDVAHWAAEWTWLPVLRDRLVAELGDTVDVHVSTTNTDPWTFRA